MLLALRCIFHAWNPHTTHMIQDPLGQTQAVSDASLATVLFPALLPAPMTMFIRAQVEAMRRRDTFIRSQLLAKVEGETSKARGLLSQRAELQEQCKRANMCGPKAP